MALSTTRRIEDQKTNVSKALPAAAATANTAGIKIGDIAELLDKVEIEISVDKTTTLAATKTITLGLETSSDNGVADSYTDVFAVLTTTGAFAANGAESLKSAGFNAPKTTPGKYTVGAYDDIRGTVPGLDAHHVGQKAVMRDLVPGYDPATAPSILVPKAGHTRVGPTGRVSTSTEGFTSARDVVARDIWELRRVYPDIPNSRLQELIQMNKDMYPVMNQ